MDEIEGHGVAQFEEKDVDEYLQAFNLAYRASYQVTEPTKTVRRVVDYFEQCMFQVSLDQENLIKVLKDLHKSVPGIKSDKCQSKQGNCVNKFHSLMSTYSAGKNKDYPNGALFLLDPNIDDIEDVKQIFKRYYW